MAIDATNSHVITPPSGAMPEELLLFLVHTTGSSKAVTVKAGDAPAAAQRGLGDLTITMGDGSSTAVLSLTPLSSSRFIQDDGTINVDIASATTGRIACFYVPRTV